MTAVRRRGFTLIELLVVIAIIGILAAMVFPVFARARESARKVVCLSNVKNIALAVQMYLADYDRMPPSEHRQEVADFYSCQPTESVRQDYATRSNPYLKFQVVLDEYVNNRGVWACPSARSSPGGFGVNATKGGVDWFERMKQASGGAVGGACPLQACSYPFPEGWGAVPDALEAMAAGVDCRAGTGGEGANAEGKAFVYNYSTPFYNWDVPTTQMDDVAKYLVVGEIGGKPASLWSTAQVAYPDLCRLGCVSCIPSLMADWENCPATQNCGAGDPALGNDATVRKSHARHLGGVNLGFADGHVAWFPSEAVLVGGHDARYFSTDDPNRSIIIEGPVNFCMMTEM